MSETNPSIEQNTRLDAKTRVDSAHGTPGGDIPLSPEPPLDVLRAIAGQDAAQAELQLRGQALDLAGILEEKQRMLDERESELNAKTAQIENELRHRHLGRKTPLDVGIDLSSAPADAPPQCESVDELQKETVARWRDMLKLAADISTPLETPTEPQFSATEQEPQSVLAEPEPEVVIAKQPASVEAEEHELSTSELDCLPEDVEAPEMETARPAPDSAAVETVELELASEPEAAICDRQPTPTNEPSPHDVKPQPHIFRMPPAEDPSELERRQFEQQRQSLLQRKEKLDARHKHVERMNEQVTSLHREALELQLSTEQLWSELLENFPSEELARRLSHTRHRLAEHFRMTSDNLAQRTDELHQLRQELNEQENSLRQKRRDIQMWADRRYDEIEMRTAELICRERELDRLEMEFDRQSIQWQQQRQAYRQEIERLSSQLQ